MIEAHLNAPGSDPGITIGEVSARTGLSVATLRAWERRFGFPLPRRLDGGHRRFPAAEVDRLEQVVRDRGAGLSLEAAIARARQGGVADTSVFAGLRRHHPELAVLSLSRRAMLAISRAIEDECRAAADRPVLLACFQHEPAFRRVEDRWRALARGAAAAVVFADFAATVTAVGAGVGGISLVALAPPDPLVQEWTVVCHGPASAACLAGRERLDGVAGARPRFEAVWSAEPTVVARAARLAVDLARDTAPELAASLDQVLATMAIDGPGSAQAAVRRTTSLANRMVALLDEPAPRGRG